MAETEGGEQPSEDAALAEAGARRARLAAEAGRLMREASSATLATLGKDGHPHAALVTPAVAPDGAVLLWLSTLSEHTRQLARDGRCSLLFLGAAEDSNPQTTPRISLAGLAARSDDPALKEAWLARHPYAAPYADFADFSLWRIEPRSALMVLGFGQAHRLRAADLMPGAEAPA
ncbi:pyridoxamine 5'-phosphate oxidase family protein [Roseomonas sp. SSH11]|uniref:Pyridoxamine 5'-phosphate oxidase family protein n=1 Tax=Pararoseomonas baculiformis TaxID=2820812 RepID=A0ABS4AH05_9PROT|nr:pyridoxamine 5'-phosphate oxidase family protein [Pararoseomonas baculiformis]MBP0446307.1 pyridoxamine 5'-phosphate oxidase family protein [Pararoseomonas baculiformis]